MLSEMCFYQPPTPEGRAGRVIDYAITDRDGTFRSAINDETLEQVQKRYPGAVMMPTREVHEKVRSHFIHGPTRITKEKFWEMLEILPPVDWVMNADAQSFKMSEMMYADITDIYVKIGGNYFGLSDSVRTTHDEACEKCRALLVKEGNDG